jgi:DNA-binding response OmpR family regulator
MGRSEYSESLRGVYVLLVDDNATRRQILRDALAYCGALVRETTGGAAGAQEILQEIVPSALVLAVRPPGDEAWALLRFVRSQRLEHGAKMPVIGFGPEALAATGRMNGTDAYVIEPIDVWALCRVLADLAT